MCARIEALANMNKYIMIAMEIILRPEHSSAGRASDCRGYAVIRRPPVQSRVFGFFNRNKNCIIVIGVDANLY